MGNFEFTVYSCVKLEKTVHWSNSHENSTNACQIQYYKAKKVSTWNLQANWRVKLRKTSKVTGKVAFLQQPTRATNFLLVRAFKLWWIFGHTWSIFFAIITSFFIKWRRFTIKTKMNSNFLIFSTSPLKFKVTHKLWFSSNWQNYKMVFLEITKSQLCKIELAQKAAAPSI